MRYDGTVKSYEDSSRVVDWEVLDGSCVCIRREGGWLLEVAFRREDWGGDEYCMKVDEKGVSRGEHIILAKLLGLKCLSYTPLSEWRTDI